MKEILTILNYTDGVNDTPFYSAEKPIVLTEYSVSMQRMSSSSITATFTHPEVLDDLWDGNQYVIFRNLQYFLKNKPNSQKDNEDARYTYTVEFVPKRELVLGNVFFYDAVSTGESVDDKYKSNSTEVIFYGSISEFAARLQASLKYSGLTDYTVIVDDGVVSETEQISFTDCTFFEALQQSYETYGVPFYFVGEHEIHFGDNANEISTVFKYGRDYSLLSVKKENADEALINRCTGIGSEDNIPYYYPNNSPKGTISAEPLSTNTTLTKDDITVQDYIVFAQNIETSDVVTYKKGAIASRSQTVNGEAYTEGSEREVTLVNLQPQEDVYVITLTLPYSGRIAITPTITYRAVGASTGTAVNALSANVLTLWTMANTTTAAAVELTETSDNTLLSGYVQAGTYQVVLRYVLSHRGASTYYYSTRFSITTPDTWVLTRDEEDSVIDLGDIGVRINITPSRDDGFTQVLVNKLITSSNLLPPLYRNTLGAERFYNAKNETYINPDTGDYYTFENEYSVNNPREYIVENEDIKPTIVGITNEAGQMIGQFLDVAYDEDDSDEQDEDGNYLHPYFFVKLPKFDGSWGFNLFDQAIEDDEMTLAMTSGNCCGCQFIIGVSDDDYQENLVQVDDDGNLLRDDDGNVRCGRENLRAEVAQERQNDTYNYEVWIALKKEYSTFGVLMPNAEYNYRPSAGDTFVILYISLPQAYIDKAEDDLKEYIIAYMAEHNTDKFNFSIEFSRIYLAQHPEIADELSENSKITLEYNGTTATFYVSQYTYNANDDEALPEIKVELSESLSISESALEHTISEIDESVTKQIANIDIFGYGKSYFLSKTSADTAQGVITFLQGLYVGNSSLGQGFFPETNGVAGYLASLTLAGKSGNPALSLTNGYIEGFRTGLRRVTTDATLETTDYLILVEATSDATITLPASPENGQLYKIHNAGFATITINGNGIYIARSSSSEFTPTLDSGDRTMVEIFYSSIVNQWYMTTNSESGSSSGTGGIDSDDLWDILGTSGTELIDASHIPSLSSLSGQLTNAQLANSSITIAGVSVSLGGSISASQIATALAGYLSDDADTLDGYHGSSSATASTYVLRDSSASAVVNAIRYNYGLNTLLSAVGWYRIFTFSRKNNNGGDSVIIHLSRNYQNTNNEGYVFAITVAYNGAISITQLAGYANTQLITKLRVDYVNSSTTYVDFYIGTSSSDNTYYVYGSGCGSFQAPALVEEATGTTYEFEVAEQGCKSDRGFTGDLSGNATTSTTATKIGSSTIGGTARGIYLSSGVPTAMSSTVGASTTPVYMSSGTITACSYSFGNASGNAALNNGTLNTNLNADMLDGLHATSFVGRSGSFWTDGQTVEEWAKTIATHQYVYSPTWWAWSDSAYLTVGDYSLDCMRYTAISLHSGDLTGTWQQKAILFVPTYSSESMMYLAQMYTMDTAGHVYLSVKRYADYDTIINGNVASATTATTLATARTLWGQSFNGSANVSGNMTGVGSITMSGALSCSSTITASGLATLNGGVKTNQITLVNGDYTATIELDEDGNIHIDKGVYSDSFLSVGGSDDNS